MVLIPLSRGILEILGLISTLDHSHEEEHDFSSFFRCMTDRALGIEVPNSVA